MENSLSNLSNAHEAVALILQTYVIKTHYVKIIT